MILSMLIGLLFSENPVEEWESRQIGLFVSGGSSAVEAGQTAEVSENLTVHYLDVEKCCCVLVRSGEHFMLIDAGSNDDVHEEETVEYLKAKGVESLDYLLITHPHMDHIRSVPEIVNRFVVNEVLMGGFRLKQWGHRFL